MDNNSDHYFIAPLPLETCRRRLRQLKSTRWGERVWTRFFRKTEKGVPFDVMCKYYSQQSIVLRGYLKRCDSHSTYVTLYSMNPPGIKTGCIGISAVSIVLVMGIGIADGAMNRLIACTILSLLIAGFAYIGTDDSDMKIHNQVLAALQNSVPLATEKPKRNLEHFPIYDKSYYFEIEE